jgi:acyl carrier protein
MSTPTIEQRVKQIVVDNLFVDEKIITPSSSFTDDLGADSLDVIELVMAIEDEFREELRNGEIPEEDARNIQTVGQAIAYIEKLSTP